MTPPRIGSLFSGYGGLDLAVEQFFGARTVWHSQYEPPDKKGRPDVHQYAARILAHHWPDTPNLGDITAIDWDQVAAEAPVDILTGGFPCTDVSLAGQRAGLNDQTRSGLWAHMAHAIAALQPRLVVIENVRGLLSAPAHSDVEPCTWCMGDGPDEPVLRALGAVLADLAGLGFDAEWIGLPASAVGAPHERWREFILAWPAAAHADQLGAHRTGTRRAGGDEPADRGQPAADADRIVPGYDGELPTGRDTVRLGVRDDTPRCGAAPADPGRSRRGPAEPDVQPGEPNADWGTYGPAIHRWEHVLGRPAPAAVDDQGRLAPQFVEWMMGLPAGWITDIPLPDGMTASKARNAQLKAGGNGVVPQQAYAALTELWHRATTPAVPAAA
ncbi:DNA cytosine methyltransferase [Kitasatospora sp. NPDC001132]